MLTAYSNHNRFKDNLDNFYQNDPHLSALAQLKYQSSSSWWNELSSDTPGIYILTGGRQVGKSTSCKLLIKEYLQNNILSPKKTLYLPCDEIYSAKDLSQILRFYLDTVENDNFLLIVDEITFVKDWDRVIKALADEGFFKKGICILTGSDSVILKEAAMRFPGRRGLASKVDFHLYPLSFSEYVDLLSPNQTLDSDNLFTYFKQYLLCGGYLRAINDLAEFGEVTKATFLTYEQWIRGDFLKRGKNEDSLLSILATLLTVGVSQVSYSKLTQKVGTISKDTCINYLRLLGRMDVLIELQAFDQNKKQGFPRKDRKFHFFDPFIQRTIYSWLKREGYINTLDFESALVEATVASHCSRYGQTYYFKGQGEVDVIWIKDKAYQALEVKWSEQIRPNDLKTLKQFKNSCILGKKSMSGKVDGITSLPVYQYLYDIGVD